MAEQIDGDPEAFSVELGEIPPTLGYGGHVPGNRDTFGRKGYTRSPTSSPMGSPVNTSSNLFNPGAPPSPSMGMGAYPGHSFEPEPEPLVSPKWKQNSPSGAHSFE